MNASPQPYNTSEDGRALGEALQALEEAQAWTYYDEEADARDRSAYYRGLPRSGAPAKRFTRLSELLKQTHRSQLTYRPSLHVYPWVDLQPNRTIHSIYSGREVTPEQFIQADSEIDQRRTQLASQLREMLLNTAPSITEQLEQGTFDLLDVIEAALPYNCEHVVPQSWFGRREPMRGDLHHLFACESDCNSFRGNTPYFDFLDFTQVVRGDCGKKVANRFEPSAGKGAVARATLYFLLRYPGQINRIPNEYDQERLSILLAWHRAHPVTEYERHRNMAIFGKQGNRNPLIDFPEWAEEIDFREGLG